MNFTAKTSDIAKQRCGLAIIFVGDKGHTSIDTPALKSQVQSAIKLGDFDGSAGSCALLLSPSELPCERLLLVGTGTKSNEDLTEQNFISALQKITETFTTTKAKDAVIFLDDIKIKDRGNDWCAQQLVQNCLLGSYQFNQLKSDKGQAPSVKKITLSANRKQLSTIKTGIKAGTAIASGSNFCRTLGNLPGNICTPSYLAKEAKALARGDKKISCKVLDEKQMKTLGMGSLLSVSAGSEQPAKLIQLEYKGAAKSKKPVVLVGKGITFDTGGISLKPGAGMDEMKFDMCGAASVLGAFKAAVEMQLALNLVVIVAASENMPSGRATKPGDIVTAMNGTTIEVLNTDAEGRLVLCDALSYAEHFKPAAVIDVATLTGACVIALGNHATGLYSNKDELADELLSAGLIARDRAWRMPLWQEYKDQLKSNFADLANIGGREGGSATAAAFLSHFAEKYDWAHLDIAGTAWNSGAAKGATGRPVPLLVEFLRARAG